uniref:UPF3 domain-containing protein n=1 Tax=Scylla olivacea TaxID=85551 RepID=A0A0P4W7Z5_SCYOL
MTVKTVDVGKRDGTKSYSENTSKKLSEVKHNIKAKKERSNGPPTKVVVRRLPPTMTEEEFMEAINPVPEYDYFTFCPADNSLGPNAFTRAYINFKSSSEIFNFRDKFDGYVFVDQKGNEFPAMVEFAPFQKVPKRLGSKKKDARCGTIDQDPDYLEFLETIANPETVTLQPLEAVLEEIQAHDRELKANNGYLKVKTPLLEYIEQRKAEKLRSKEEKREERRRKEFERKKAKEDEKRKKKEVKEQKEMKKKDDQKEDASGVKLQVLQPERGKDDGPGDVRPTRKERDRERYERERQRRMEEDQQRREREKEKVKFNRRDKEKEREERIRRQEEKFRLRDEERMRQREEGKEERNRHKDEGRDDRMRHRDEGREDRVRYRDEGRDDRIRHRDDGRDDRARHREEGREDRTRHREEGRHREEMREDRTRHREEEWEEHSKYKEEGREEKGRHRDEMREEGQEGHRVHKPEGVKSKRYSEGRKKEEKDRRIKEDRGKRYEDGHKTKSTDDYGASVDHEDHHRGESHSKEEGDAGVGTSADKTVTPKKREKDPRVERRIRNKDRPAMALYRPGQSRLSSRMRHEREEGVDTSSSSPSPVMLDAKKSAPPKKRGASTHKNEAAAGHCSDSLSVADSQKDDNSVAQRDSGGEDNNKDE